MVKVIFELIVKVDVYKLKSINNIEAFTFTVSCPDVAVAKILSAVVGTTPPTQVPVEFQFPPVLLIVITAIYYTFIIFISIVALVIVEALSTLNANTSPFDKLVLQVDNVKSVLICCEDKVGFSVPAIDWAADVGIVKPDALHTSTTTEPDAFATTYQL